jgi:hypothetical protein
MTNAIKIGPIFYGGGPSSFAGINCNIHTVLSQNLSFIFGKLSTDPYFYAGSGALTYSGFNIPPAPGDSNPPIFWVPGTPMRFIGANTGGVGFPFTITDHSYNSGTSTLTINTTLSGASLPPVPTDVSGNIAASIDTVRDWACSNCTGSPDAIDYSQAPAQHQPLYTYSKRSYTCANNVSNVANSIDLNSGTLFTVEGNWVSLTVNVSRADTSATATVTLDPGSPFGNLPVVNQVTGAVTSWGSGGSVVDLKAAGTRVITPTAVTGAQGADSLTPPGANSYIALNPSSLGATNVSAESAAQCPVVSIEWKATR